MPNQYPKHQPIKTSIKCDLPCSRHLRTLNQTRSLVNSLLVQPSPKQGLALRLFEGLTFLLSSSCNSLIILFHLIKDLYASGSSSLSIFSVNFSSLAYNQTTLHDLPQPYLVNSRFDYI